MNINIEEDLILPVATAFLAIAITILHTQCMFVSTHEAIIEQLVTQEAEAFQDAVLANKEVDSLTKELQGYRFNTKALISLGASRKQAFDVIKAAEVYNLDPKLLGALIASESSFTARTHALSCVVGLCGINLGCGSNIPYNPYTDSGNILDSAKLLRDYKNLYGSDLKAVARYKGYSALGFRQSEHVMEIYRSIR